MISAALAVLKTDEERNALSDNKKVAASCHIWRC